MITRTMASVLHRMAAQYPVVTISPCHNPPSNFAEFGQCSADQNHAILAQFRTTLKSTMIGCRCIQQGEQLKTQEETRNEQRIR